MKKLPLPQLALEDRVDPAVLEAPVKTEMTCLTKNIMIIITTEMQLNVTECK